MSTYWTDCLTSSLKFYPVSFLQSIKIFLKTVFRAYSQERDSGETAVDVEAARLVAQKLGENGIGGDPRSFDEDDGWDSKDII